MWVIDRKVGQQMNLNNKIINETQEVKQFALSVAMARKNDEQKRIDSKFNMAIKSFDDELDRLIYTTDVTTFVCSIEAVDKIRELIIFCKEAIDNNYVTEQQVYKIKDETKKIKKKLSEEWDEYYEKETKSLEEVLKLSKNITGINVNSLLINLQEGRNWDANKNIRNKMTESISSAKDLINKLELKENIVDFLRKMVKQEATLLDVDEDIMKWIKNEHLEGTIKITF